MHPKLTGLQVRALRYLTTHQGLRGAIYGTISMKVGLGSAEKGKGMGEVLIQHGLVDREETLIKITDAGKRWLGAFDEIINQQIREYVYEDYEFALLRFLYHLDIPAKSEEIPKLLEDNAPQTRAGYSPALNLSQILKIELRKFIKETGGQHYELTPEGRKYVEMKAEKFGYNIGLTAAASAMQGTEIIKVVEKKDPFLSPSTFQEIVKRLRRSIERLEKKPRLYSKYGEDEFRDHIMESLEDFVESTTLTAESFNRQGKTDILLKHADGTNIFVVECKIWRGASDMTDAIDQLMGYLTWRDSKAALIFFSHNTNFSKVIKEIETTVPKHSQYHRMVEKYESSFSYLFTYLEDSDKYIHLEIIAGNFPPLTTNIT